MFSLSICSKSMNGTNTLAFSGQRVLHPLFFPVLKRLVDRQFPFVIFFQEIAVQFIEQVRRAKHLQHPWRKSRRLCFLRRVITRFHMSLFITLSALTRRSWSLRIRPVKYRRVAQGYLLQDATGGVVFAGFQSIPFCQGP